MTDQEFKERWIAHVMTRVPEFTMADAVAAWEACTPAAHREDYEDDPEGAADAEMDYWE